MYKQELDAAEAEMKQKYEALGHCVEFADLLIQTSNIKVPPIVSKKKPALSLHKTQSLCVEFADLLIQRPNIKVPICRLFSNSRPLSLHTMHLSYGLFFDTDTEILFEVFPAGVTNN